MTPSCVKLTKTNQHRREFSRIGTGLPTLKSTESVELGDARFKLFSNLFYLNTQDFTSKLRSSRRKLQMVISILLLFANVLFSPFLLKY